MIPSPEQHKAALDAAVDSIDPTILRMLRPFAPRRIIEGVIAVYLAHLSAQPSRPRWMNTRFGGSDNSPEKRDADLVAMIDALAERVAELEAKKRCITCDGTGRVLQLASDSKGYSGPARCPGCSPPSPFSSMEIVEG